MASYRGKQCKVVRKNGRHATVRFNSTGSEMTVPAVKIVNGKRKGKKRKATSRRRSNPWVSFEGHGGKHKRVRGKAAQKKGRRKGVKRESITFFVRGKTRARGKYLSSAKPSGYRVIGRGSKAITKAAQSARQREAYKRAPGIAKIQIRKMLAEARKKRR